MYTGKHTFPLVVCSNQHALLLFLLISIETSWLEVAGVLNIKKYSEKTEHDE